MEEGPRSGPPGSGTPPSVRATRRRAAAPHREQVEHYRQKDREQYGDENHGQAPGPATQNADLRVPDTHITALPGNKWGKMTLLRCFSTVKQLMIG